MSFLYAVAPCIFVALVDKKQSRDDALQYKDYLPISSASRRNPSVSSANLRRSVAYFPFHSSTKLSNRVARASYNSSTSARCSRSMHALSTRSWRAIARRQGTTNHRAQTSNDQSSPAGNRQPITEGFGVGRGVDIILLYYILIGRTWVFIFPPSAVNFLL